MNLKTLYRKNVLGKETGGSFPPSKIRHMKWAVHNDNYDAFLAAKKKYVKGGRTSKNFEISLRYMDPLYPLSKADRRKFKKHWLTSEQREMVEESEKFAKEWRKTLEKWWKRDRIKGQDAK